MGEGLSTAPTNGARSKMFNISHFISDSRYRNKKLYEWDLRAGRTRLLSKPLYIQIEPTNCCNLECVMCARPYYDPDANRPGHMSLETFEKIVPYMKAVETVFLFGYGEPLAGKNFWVFLDRCAGLGVRTEIFTNGALLTPANSERLVAAGLAALTVSLDASTEGAFQTIRKTSLNSILENLKALNEAKVRLKKNNPALKISFVLMRDNIGELEGLIDIAAGLGVTEIQVSNMMVYSKELDRQSAFHFQDEAKKVLDGAVRKAKGLGINLTPPSFGPGVADCLMPFNMLFFNWDGKVRPCCSAAFVSEKYNLPIGDLNRQPLDEIWNSEKMQEIRRALLGKGVMPPQCAGCGFRVKDIKAYRRYLD
jgi:radical SAM protein with 4Fe4S-binding SPASM domain